MKCFYGWNDEALQLCNTVHKICNFLSSETVHLKNFNKLSIIWLGYFISPLVIILFYTLYNSYNKDVQMQSLLTKVNGMQSSKWKLEFTGPNQIL